MTAAVRGSSSLVSGCRCKVTSLEPRGDRGQEVSLVGWLVAFYATAQSCTVIRKGGAADMWDGRAI